MAGRCGGGKPGENTNGGLRTKVMYTVHCTVWFGFVGANFLNHQPILIEFYFFRPVFSRIRSVIKLY